MNVDFEFWMVIALLVSGVLWLLDVKWWKPLREAKAEALRSASAEFDVNEFERIRREPTLVEYARSFFPVILVVLILRSFLMEPFRIPSGSMMPTLLIGDFIMVNKFSYGLRLPVTNYKLLELGEPSRGDVVVFRFPKEPEIDYIKRVIGLPGDVIGYSNKQIYVNGKAVNQEFLSPYEGVGSGFNMTGNRLHKEQLGEVSHHILVDPDRLSQYGEFTVPAGEYFVMGDNRDNSNDSRFWGFVPEQNLVGKALLIWMNWDDGIGWGRIGTLID